MGSHHRAVQQNVFHIRIIGEMLMQIIPDVVVTPAGKALVNCVPLTVFFRQKPPLGPAAGDPQHSFDEKTAFFIGSCIDP